MGQQKQEFAVESAESKSTEIISRAEAKEKMLKRYFTGIPCKHGHVDERLVSGSRCVTCRDISYKKYISSNKEKVSKKKREYRANNKDSISEYNKMYQAKNVESINARTRAWRQCNSDYREKQRKYREENKSDLALKKRDYDKEYYKENKREILQKNKERASKNPIPQIIRNSLLRLRNNWLGGRKAAEKTLGYSYEEFSDHISSKFVVGMGWDNYGDWEIDHIKPVSLFIKEGVTDPKTINALSNLQPLWKLDNRSKGAKYNAQNS